MTSLCTSKPIKATRNFALLLILLMTTLPSTGCILLYPAMLPDLEKHDLPTVLEARPPLDERERELWATLVKLQSEQPPFKISADAQSYLDTILNRLVSYGQINTMAFNVSIIPTLDKNAGAFPNGVIFFTLGIMNEFETEDELALVMGHEISHAVYRHTLEELLTEEGVGMSVSTVILFGGIGGIMELLKDQRDFFKYNREQELEADLFGTQLMIGSGYDPRMAIDFWRRRAKAKKSSHSAYGTHPGNQERILAIEALISQSSLELGNSVNDVETFSKVKAEMAALRGKE